MKQVQCVSLPRSGHNMLIGHLRKYFSSTNACSHNRHPAKKPSMFRRSKPQPQPTRIRESDSPFHYCEYYYACRQHPCVDPQNTFQKSHDFELQLPVNPNGNYIIQKRKRLDLMISWFEMRLEKKREVDSSAGFEAFLQRHQQYVDHFQLKWITTPIANRLVLDYDDYLISPIETLSEVIRFFDADHQLKHDVLAKVVKNVRPAKDNSDFRFLQADAA